MGRSPTPSNRIEARLEPSTATGILRDLHVLSLGREYFMGLLDAELRPGANLTFCFSYEGIPLSELRQVGENCPHLVRGSLNINFGVNGFHFQTCCFAW